MAGILINEVQSSYKSLLAIATLPFFVSFIKMINLKMEKFQRDYQILYLYNSIIMMEIEYGIFGIIKRNRKVTFLAYITPK